MSYIKDRTFAYMEEDTENTPFTFESRKRHNDAKEKYKHKVHIDQTELNEGCYSIIYFHKIQLIESHI
jgi:hypothetical protein